MSPAPKRNRFSGSDSIFIGRAPLPIKSANAPELSKGKTTRIRISVIKVAFFFTVARSCYVKLISAHKN